MLLESSASSLSVVLAPQTRDISKGAFSPSCLKIGKGKGGISHGVQAMAAANNMPLTGVVFEPFKELDLSRDLDLVPASSTVSIARQRFSDDCEAVINEQIKKKVEAKFNELGGMCERGELDPEKAYELFKEFDDQMVLECQELMKEEQSAEEEGMVVKDKSRQ